MKKIVLRKCGLLLHILVLCLFFSTIFFNFAQAQSTFTIFGYVFTDSNSNEIRDGGETIWPGRTVELYTGPEYVPGIPTIAVIEYVRSTTTDGNGFYIFSGLTGGENWRVRHYPPPSGYDHTTDDSIPFVNVQSNKTHDFGLVLLATPTPLPTTPVPPTPTPLPPTPVPPTPTPLICGLPPQQCVNPPAGCSWGSFGRNANNCIISCSNLVCLQPTPIPPPEIQEIKPIRWGIYNPLAGNPQPQNVVELIILVSDWIFNIAGSLIVILIIYSGVRFLISRGNPSEIQKARGILYWALVGFAVVMIGKGFIYLVESILNGVKPIF